MSSRHVVIIILSFHQNSEPVPSGQLQLPPDQLISVSPLLRRPPPPSPTHIPPFNPCGFIKWIHQVLSRQLCYAKSLQSCPTLCDPIDRSPPGSAVPGILQARTPEWVAISFSNA